jgi:hypothetical protein
VACERHSGHDEPIGLPDCFVVQAADERAAADQVPRPRGGTLCAIGVTRPETDRVAGDDAAAADAIVELTALGVDSGPCGAASLAALRVLASEPARSRLGLCPDSSVALLNTEGSDAAGRSTS